MKQRSPVTAALFSFIIPIYALYWLVVTAKDLRRRGVKPPSAALLFAPFLLILFFIFTMAFRGLFHGASVDSTSTTSSAGTALFALLMPLLFIASFVVTIVYYYKFCKAAEEATHKQISAGLTFILMLVLLPVAVYLIQEKLNETVGGPAPTSTSPTQPFAGSPPSPPQAPMSPQPPAPPVQ